MIMSFSGKIKSVVEENNTLAGRIFDLIVQLLIIVSLVSFSVETLPDLSPDTMEILGIIETITVIIFSIEYLLRIIIARSKTAFIFSFYGMIDLAAILPFYISTGIDLRSLRAFRLLRLFRAFKLVRYSKAVQHFKEAFILIREELILFFSLTLIVLFLAATGIYYLKTKPSPRFLLPYFIACGGQLPL